MIRLINLSYNILFQNCKHFKHFDIRLDQFKNIDHISQYQQIEYHKDQYLENYCCHIVFVNTSNLKVQRNLEDRYSLTVDLTIRSIY